MHVSTRQHTQPAKQPAELLWRLHHEDRGGIDVEGMILGLAVAMVMLVISVGAFIYFAATGNIGHPMVIATGVLAVSLAVPLLESAVVGSWLERVSAAGFIGSLAVLIGYPLWNWVIVPLVLATN